MVGDMKRRRKQFEDKVKKVQKAPRIRPLWGLAVLARWVKKRGRESGAKRGGRGSVVKETREVKWWWLAGALAAAAGWTLPLLLAVLPRSLPSLSLVSVGRGWEVLGGPG